jgi:hypothetical protein
MSDTHVFGGDEEGISLRSPLTIEILLVKSVVLLVVDRRGVPVLCSGHSGMRYRLNAVNLDTSVLMHRADRRAPYM